MTVIQCDVDAVRELTRFAVSSCEEMRALLAALKSSWRTLAEGSWQDAQAQEFGAWVEELITQLENKLWYVEASAQTQKERMALLEQYLEMSVPVTRGGAARRG